MTKTVAEHGVAAIIHFAAPIVVPDSVARAARLLRATTRSGPQLIEAAIEAGVREFHLLVDRGRLAGDAEQTRSGDVADGAVWPYGRSKLMTEMDAARMRRGAYGPRFVALRYFNVAGADPKGRTGQSSASATHLIKGGCKAALGRARSWTFSAPIIRRPTAPACATTSMSAISSRAHSWHSAICATAAQPAVMNCGYGQGSSVLEVIEAIGASAGCDFPCEIASRRPGDPAALVADATRIRETLGWKPEHDDLDEIVRDAYAWEKKLNSAG